MGYLVGHVMPAYLDLRPLKKIIQLTQLIIKVNSLLRMLNRSIYHQFPMLDLDNIVLRELTSDDSEDYFGYMSKLEMPPFLADSNSPSTIPQAADELKYWSSLFHHQRGFCWGISLKDNNKLIGTGFNTVSTMRLKAEISYDLDPAF